MTKRIKRELTLDQKLLVAYSNINKHKLPFNSSAVRWLNEIERVCTRLNTWYGKDDPQSKIMREMGQQYLLAVVSTPAFVPYIEECESKKRTRLGKILLCSAQGTMERCKLVDDGDIDMIGMYCGDAANLLALGLAIVDGCTRNAALKMLENLDTANRENAGQEVWDWVYRNKE